MTDIETAPKEIDDSDVQDMAFTAGPSPETKPKRGRPPLSDEEKARRAAERAANPNAPRRGRPRGKTDLTNDIAGALTTINFAFYFVPEQYQGDALTEDEIADLASALNHAAQNNARMYKYLSTAFKGGMFGTWMPLIIATGGIVKRRMDNHGITVSSLLNPQPRIVDAEYAETPEYATSPV